MGYWKPVYLEEDYNIAMSGTETFDLPEKGDLSHLELILKATNGAGVNNLNNPEYSVSKIEVLHHGNHAIKAMDGRIALFAAAKDMPRVPELQVYNNIASQNQISRIPILFGRKPFDIEHFLRLEDMGDCSLKLTRDFTTGSEYKTDTAYLASAGIDVDLIAWQYFGTPSLDAPKGFFKNSLVKEWSPTSNSEKTSFKPATGNKWRNLIMQFEAASWWMEQKIAKVQFDENNESPIFYNRLTEDLEVENTMWDNLIFKTMFKCETDTVGIKTMIAGHKLPTEGGHIIGTAVVQPTARFPYMAGGSGNQLSVYCDVDSVWQIEGVAYQECLLLNLERMFGGLYDSKDKSQPRLKLEAAAGGISTILPRVRVHLEELIEPPYIP